MSSMRTAAFALPIELITTELATGWGIRPRSIRPLLVGFGSHHWDVLDDAGARYFVTAGVRRDPALDADASGLAAARALADSGFAGALAPLPGLDGAVVRRFLTAEGDAAMLSVTDWVEPESPVTGDDVVSLLLDLHGRTEVVTAIARCDPRAPSYRAELGRVLADLDRPWSGPYGERARRAGRSVRGAAIAALDRFDRLRASLSGTEVVITHGEPHEGNLLRRGGVPVLIDWDTARIAPAARDLWDLTTAQQREYEARSGRRLGREALELYRLRWDLDEVGEYLALFSVPHEATEDTMVSWEALTESIERLVAQFRRPDAEPPPVS